MKKIFKSIKASFIIIGSCIGAGFISGQEIVGFFNNANPAFSCFLACLCFFILSVFLLSIGGKYNSSYEMNKCLFKSSGNLINFIMITLLFIITGTMLAGADSLFSEFFSVDKKYCYFSVLFIILADLLCFKGIKGIEIINTILTPLIIFFLLFFLFKKNEFSFTAISYKTGENYKGILYASMNMFLVSPVLIEEGKRLKTGGKFLTGFISTVVILVLLILILSSILYEGANAINSDLPLLYVLSGGTFSKIIFGILMLIGIFTSLITAYYPVNSFFMKKFGERGKYTFMLLAFLFSRIGLKKIVTYIYPVMGLLGGLYFIAIIIIEFIKKIRYKDSKACK